MPETNNNKLFNSAAINMEKRLLISGLKYEPWLLVESNPIELIVCEKPM